jgi:SAM-dependent methyltransferase
MKIRTAAMGPLKFTYLHPKFRRFVRDFWRFRHLSESNQADPKISWADRYPCLDDNTPTTVFDAHYVYHPAWAARIIAEARPALHVDVASTLNFCSMLSAFVPVQFLDIRPARLDLDHLTSQGADLTALPFEAGSVQSLSCMHVVEHIGLGRYGDPLDPEGDLKAMSELKRVLAGGGSLLFVVPVGRPRVRFNAHRIYSYENVQAGFAGLDIVEFALVDDQGTFTRDANPAVADQQDYGCGCWWFRK